MKGRLSRQGFLEIYRNDPNPGLYQSQFCPFQNQPLSGDLTPCGTWCPHHGEVKRVDSGRVGIEICHGKTLIFTDFKDET